MQAIIVNHRFFGKTPPLKESPPKKVKSMPKAHGHLLTDICPLTFAHGYLPTDICPRLFAHGYLPTAIGGLFAVGICLWAFGFGGLLAVGLWIWWANGRGQMVVGIFLWAYFWWATGTTPVITATLITAANIKAYLVSEW